MNTDNTSAATKLRYMLGTHGSPDYLIIAQNGDVALGIKPLFLADMNFAGSFMGLRLRSARVKKKAKAAQTPDGAAKFPTPMPLDKAWPGIKWGKIDHERCSVVIGTVFNKGVFDFPKIIETIDKADIIGQFCQFLEQIVPAEHFVVSPDTMKSWLMMQFEKALGMYLQLHNQAVFKTTHQLVSGNVIDFADALHKQMEAAGIDTTVLHKGAISSGIPISHEVAADEASNIMHEEDHPFQLPTPASDKPTVGDDPADPSNK
jgi:hypothetical protein